MQEAVRAALGLGGKAGQRVVVLSEDFWAQSTVLNTAQTEGLSPHEIAQALGFEIEPFSNVPPLDSVVGYRALPQGGTTTSYWVVETSHGELAVIRDIVASTGGHLVYAAHPGGMPAPIGDVTPGTTWQRLELWQRGAVHVSAAAPGEAQVQSVTPGQWDAGRIAPSEYREVLKEDAETPAAPSLEPSEWPRLCLTEDVCLRRWLRGWATCLESNPGQLALMVPAAPPTPIQRYVAVGVILECAIAALCIGHWSWFAWQRNAVCHELAGIGESVAQITRVEQENGNLKRSIAELSQANRAREEVARRTALQRRALPALLHSLGSVRPPDVVIQDIHDEGRQVFFVSGLSMTVGGADDLLTRLSKPLQGAGWTVKPVRKDAQQLLDDGGPWRFSLRVSLMTPLSGSPGNPTEGAESSQGVSP